jgi:hypothetical protein
MSSINLYLGLPLFLLPNGFHSSTLLGILSPSIRITWPSQTILLLFTCLTISAFFICIFSLKNVIKSYYKLLSMLIYSIRIHYVLHFCMWGLGVA